MPTPMYHTIPPPRPANFMEIFLTAKDRNETLWTGMRRIKRGETIFQPGDPANTIYFIAGGKVKISVLNNEQKEITKGIYGVGDLFGEQAVLGDAFRRDHAMALEDTVLRVISACDMLLLLQNRADLTMFLMQLIAYRRQNMENRLESLVFRDSRSRIVECLVHLTIERGRRVGYEWELRNPITHQEIANLTATSRQTVTTTLNDLRYAKILTFNRKRMLVRDLDKLKAVLES